MKPEYGEKNYWLRNLHGNLDDPVMCHSRPFLPAWLEPSGWSFPSRIVMSLLVRCYLQAFCTGPPLPPPVGKEGSRTGATKAPAIGGAARCWLLSRAALLSHPLSLSVWPGLSPLGCPHI